MGKTLLTTGVQLGLIREVNSWLQLIALQNRLEARRLEAIQSGQAVFIETHTFVDVERDGEHYRVNGTTAGPDEVSAQADPTSQLLRLAHGAREDRLGDILGDLPKEGGGRDAMGVLRRRASHRAHGQPP